MAISVKGTNLVEAMLRNVSDRVSDTARKTMHRGADRIVREAKLNAPEDTEALVDSIHKEVSYGARGRVQIDIVAGGMVNPRTNQPVETYAVEIHENYEGREEQPGEKTLAKRSRHPDRYVGEKFLERALNDELPRLTREMIRDVSKEVRRK